MSNNKQKSRFSISDITKQDFSKLLKKFNNSPYIGLKSKQVHNKPTKANFFLIKQINKLMKSERHVRLCTNFIKSGVNETTGHVNKYITTTCADKNKQTSNAHYIKG